MPSQPHLVPHFRPQSEDPKEHQLYTAVHTTQQPMAVSEEWFLDSGSVHAILAIGLASAFRCQVARGGSGPSRCRRCRRSPCRQPWCSRRCLFMREVSAGFCNEMHQVKILQFQLEDILKTFISNFVSERRNSSATNCTYMVNCNSNAISLVALKQETNLWCIRVYKLICAWCTLSHLTFSTRACNLHWHNRWHFTGIMDRNEFGKQTIGLSPGSYTAMLFSRTTRSTILLLDSIAIVCAWKSIKDVTFYEYVQNSTYPGHIQLCFRHALQPAFLSWRYSGGWRTCPKLWSLGLPCCHEGCEPKCWPDSRVALCQESYTSFPVWNPAVAGPKKHL